MRQAALFASLAFLPLGLEPAPAQESAGPGTMTFFVTSVGPGKGADIGGLEGADRHCQSLAQAAGATNRDLACLPKHPGIGIERSEVRQCSRPNRPGPRQNARGVVIATNVEELHAANNNLTKQAALDEKGQPVNGRTDKPNKHDMLTGSRPDGTAFPGAPFADMTCGNWTKGGSEGSAMTGHHDRAGPIDASWAVSWNSAHPTRGCGPEELRSTGGDGLFYCFAEK